MVILFMMLVGVGLLSLLWAFRPRTPLEWLALVFVVVWLAGCSSAPLTPGQQEILRRRQVPPVVYCEVRGGDKTCRRITHDQVRQILNEVNR